MSGKVPKIVPKIKHTEASPIIAWIRAFFLNVERDAITPPPGPQTPDGKAIYRPHNRHADDQSSRSVEPALAQGGVAHKIAGNYYYERDSRRMVTPPTPIYKIDKEGQMEVKEATGEPIPFDQFQALSGFKIGPDQNYGLNPKIPTPGFGYEWTRNITNEEITQQRDPELVKAQKFDKYLKTGRP